MISDDFALQAWETAEYHLAGALAQQPDAFPAIAVHVAYYAMFHAARAVLLRVNGAAPKTHASVIRQFGLLAQTSSDELKGVARDLNRVEGSRIIADYSQVKRLSPTDARDAVEKAQRFLETCASEHGFPRVSRRA